MTIRRFLFCIAAISLFSSFLPVAYAVDSRGIEAVRGKKVLDSADLKVIDDFLAQALNEILNTDDFTSISNTRAIIIANSASTEPGQVQFAEQFSQSAQSRILAALQQADGLTPPSRRFRIVTNLLMLLDDLADLRLINLPLKYVDGKNAVISYWAVHCVTNPGIINKLNSGKEPDAARQIVRRLDEIIPVAEPETLGLIATFGGSVKIPDGAELLFKVADRRIASYADWSVKYELLDAAILQLLADKMEPANPGRAEAAKRFGQMYSYVFQRYIKGDKTLNKTQKEQLASVLVETEKNCLHKLLKKQSNAIKKAVDAGDLNVLLTEHNNLLGNPTKQGTLTAEINFDYGKAADGSQLKSPLVLAEPGKSS